MSSISDPLWNEISSAGGGLPAEARTEVEEAARVYRLDEGADIYRVKSDTRKALARAEGELDNLSSDLQLLESSGDFRRFNARGADISLAQHLTALDAIRVTLSEAKLRLAKRSRKNAHRERLLIFFVELLEIRAWFSRIDVPNQVKETSSNAFHSYLRLCLELVEPDATEDERAKLLIDGIDQAVKVFSIRRSDPIYSWQWRDLFPQSYQALMKSSKYLKG
jgi:transcription initiation factor TFIIIB Brf1 subunit/transcription initiation factor TFIIB